jgi:hypothetical protein
VNENDCGGDGCLELSLSICECLDGRTEEDGGRTGESYKEIESLNKEVDEAE